MILEVAAYANRIVNLRDGGIDSIEVSRELTANTNPPPATPQPGAINTKNGGLTFRDLIRTAFGNLRRRPVRNILTSAGVVIGIVTLVAMVSFGVGVQSEVNRNFETLGLENVFISPTFPEENDAFDPFGVAEPITPITPDIVSSFRSMPEVETVTPMLTLPSNMEVSLAFRRKNAPIRLSSGSGGMGSSNDGDLAVPVMLAGTPLGEGDSEGLVIMDGLADELLAETGGSYEDLIGQSVTLTVRLPRGETRDFTTTLIGVEQGVHFESARAGLKRTHRRSKPGGTADPTPSQPMVLIRW